MNARGPSERTPARREPRGASGWSVGLGRVREQALIVWAAAVYGLLFLPILVRLLRLVQEMEQAQQA